MSDYYGNATLEDWLYEEVLHRCPDITQSSDIPGHVVKMFEFWRVGIEADVQAWMDSHDGDGNSLSWRGWGRGFNSIDDNSEQEFNELVALVRTQLQFPVLIDTCTAHNHQFAKLADHPTNEEGRPRCPHCLALFFERHRDRPLANP